MYEARQNKEKVSRRIEVGGVKRQTKQDSVAQIIPIHQVLPIQRFYVPQSLDYLIEDIIEVKNDMAAQNCDGDTDHYVEGTIEWGEGTYDAGTRKLDEWYGVKTLMEAHPQEIDKIYFGMNDVEEPDVYLRNGNIEAVVENKYVSGDYTQIMVNAKKAIEQLLIKNRSVRNAGHLIARIELSPETSQNFSMSGIHYVQIISKLLDFTNELYTSDKVKVQAAHTLNVEIINFPEYGNKFQAQFR